MTLNQTVMHLLVLCFMALFILSSIYSFFLAIIASKLTMPQALCSYIRQGDRMRSAIILNDVWRQGYNTDQLFEDKCNEVSLNMYDFIPGIATSIFNT